MAIPFSCANTVPYQNHPPRNSSLFQFNKPITHKGSPKIISINCEYSKGSKLEIGSPIIVIEAPKMLKTAASVPCLRVNSGLVKAGDVGRYTLPLSIKYSNSCRFCVDYYYYCYFLDILCKFNCENFL